MNRLSNEVLLGYAVVNSDKRALLADIVSWIDEGSHCRWLACINPHSYAVANANSIFSSALKSSDWLVPDGIGIVFASKILGGDIHERITGSDIFRDVHDYLNTVGGSVFLLGAKEETLLAMCRRMLVEYPAIKILGTYSPPFKSMFSQQETDEMVSAINAASPDVLWVGMSSPKQDIWIYANHARLNVKFAAGVGAVFDFYAGSVKRSNPIFQKLGLEWLPRLIQEPKRLWRRMFVSAPLFLWDVALEKLCSSTKK